MRLGLNGSVTRFGKEKGAEDGGKASVFLTTSATALSPKLNDAEIDEMAEASKNREASCRVRASGIAGEVALRLDCSCT